MNKSRQIIVKAMSLIGILLVCLVLFIAPAQGKTVLTKKQTADYLDKISEYEMKKVVNPTYGSVGGEWLIMGLARYGTLTESYMNTYLTNLKAEVKKCNGVLSEKKYTEYARVVLALSSIDADPTDIEGYNLIRPLAELDNVIKTGLNGVTFSLIALDCGNYTIPDTKEGYTGKKTTREALISILLNAQLNDGGWAYLGSKSDVDMTAMVIQALGKYYQQDKVKKAVDKAVKMLSSKQNSSGAFSTGSSENCESTAQVLTAMTILGIDVSDSRFIKNDNTILDGLLQYYKDGGFKHTEKSFVNQMSTEQAMYALTAYYRGLTDENGLYDMKDNTKYKKIIKSNSNAKQTKNKKKKKKSTKKSTKKNTSKNETQSELVQNKTDQNESTTNTLSESKNNKEKSTKKKKDKKSSKKEGKEQSSQSQVQETETTTVNKEKIENNKKDGNYYWIGILFAVMLFAGAAVFYKKKSKLLVLLMVCCITFSGCGKNTASESAGTCTILVECSTINDNLKDLDKGLKGHIPKDGIILKEQEVSFEKDDSVYDVLSRELKKNNILMEASFTAKSAYVEGIDNIYEFSCGELSGWMYSVNGEYPQVSCSDYKVKDGDKIQWRYTCDLGEDVKVER